MSRSATTTVIVCAAMMPKRTSTCAVAAWTGDPPPSITPMKAPGRVTRPGGAHLVEAGQQGLGGAAVDDLADGLGRQQTEREACLVLGVLLTEGREAAPASQRVRGHRVADDDARDRDEGDAFSRDGTAAQDDGQHRHQPCAHGEGHPSPGVRRFHAPPRGEDRDGEHHDDERGRQPQVVDDRLDDERDQRELHEGADRRDQHRAIHPVGDRPAGFDGHAPTLLRRLRRWPRLPARCRSGR